MLLSAPADRAASQPGLRVTFLDVGQGDSALLQDGNGFDVLIDGGSPSAGSGLVAFLLDREARELEVMVVSHAHRDHIGGLIAVLQEPAISVEQVLFNGYPDSTDTWQAFTQAVAGAAISMTVATFPAFYTWGDFQASVLNPEAGLSSPDQNEASLVLRVEYGFLRFLFTGDIGHAAEEAILKRTSLLEADLLKVAHHGSLDSSGPDFLAAVQPGEAVISVGKNSYGHPAYETITALQAVGARLWRTDFSGNLQVTSDGSRLEVLPEYAVFLYLPAVSAQP